MAGSRRITAPNHPRGRHVPCAIGLALGACPLIAHRALAQSEPVFLTVPASTVGTHLEFANTAGSGGFTKFSLFGAATHADIPPPPMPPALHTLVIVFEWRIAPGTVHDATTWAQSPDFITTVVGGITNTFSTGAFTTPGAWDTVAVHLYAGFPITVSATFDHSWTPAPSPSSVALLATGTVLTMGRRRRVSQA
jgi:hypothetical protein